jgi:serine phosphatase RsbU (regulator of sigma subunit)/anti-sigma regulatory factor (Ser/Thr protein kinase)
MPPVTRTLTLLCDAGAVASASAWARGSCAELDVAEDDVYRLDLCVTELLTNIVSYAHPDSGPHLAVLDLRIEHDVIRLVVSDAGVPFDPRAAPAPSMPMSLEHASIGGHGIRLVRNFSEGCTYRREAGRNVFTVLFKRKRAAVHGRVRRGADRRVASGEARFPLTRSDGTRIEREARGAQNRRLFGFTSNLAIFRGVPFELIEDVVARCPMSAFADGQVLLEPGQRNRHVLLVIQGRLRVHLESPQTPDFVEVPVGECVGELSIIDGKEVSAYVVADSGCRLMLIDSITFLSRVLPIPGVAHNLMQVLTERMRRSNARLIERLRATMELERLQNELRVARQIQESMLPSRSPLFPEHPEIDCDGRMRAARAVGGDFYDAFYIDSHRLFLAIGDVCDKGMPAALFMVRAVTLLRSEATRRSGAHNGQIQRIVGRTNRLLCEGNDSGLFVTLFCAILDTATGALAFVNAGHNPPLLAPGDASCGRLAGPRNPIVGLVKEQNFAVGEERLAPGDMLLLYTDGITEAEDANGCLFGEERLATLVDRHRRRSARAVIESVFAEVHGFSAGREPSDDITLLVLNYHGSAPR